MYRVFGRGACKWDIFAAGMLRLGRLRPSVRPEAVLGVGAAPPAAGVRGRDPR
jgi:hypothetical protein